jgi:hypothetical protein
VTQRPQVRAAQLVVDLKAALAREQGSRDKERGGCRFHLWRWQFRVRKSRHITVAVSKTRHFPGAYYGGKSVLR